jgi:uncharacterized protein
MTHAQNAYRAIALSSFDLLEAHELLVYSCEDCACPVIEHDRPRGAGEPALTSTDSRRWVSGEHVVDLKLDNDHQLLFNASGRGGVAVVNDAAHRIFRSIKQPVTISDVEATWPDEAREVAGIFNKLSRLDVIHPAGQAPHPEFSDGQVLTAWLHMSGT